MRPLKQSLVSLVLLGAVASCGGAADAAPEASCRTAVPEMTIDGGAEGLHRVSGLAWGAEGRLFVLDGGDKRLIAYDSTGRELWRRGREGAGPGEMRDVRSGLWNLDGALVVSDFGNHRLSLWTADGDPLPGVPLSDFDFGGGFPGTASPLSPERVLAMVMRPMQPGSTTGTPGAFVVAVRGGSRADTLATFTFPAPQMVRSGGVMMPVFPPLAAYPTAAASAAGTVYLSRDGGYTIERFAAGGRPLTPLLGPPEAPPVTEADRQRALRRLPGGIREEDVQFPASLPAVGGLAATYEGDLLVRTNFRHGDRVRWDRWASGDVYREAFMLPERFDLVAFQGERLAVAETDSLDVPHVGVYRLTGAALCAGPPPGG